MARVDRRGIGVLALGHLAADACQGAVPALLPFLIARRGLSYGEASALVLAATVASSIVQPVFGHLSDRRSLPWLMPLGVLLAGVGIALVGVTDGYAATFATVVVSGLGVAAFHPEASRYANYLSGAQRAAGMSYFSVGGNAGFAIGPLMVTPLVLLFGLPGTLALVVLPAVVAVVMAIEQPRLVGFRPTPGAVAGAAEGLTDEWGAFTRLSLAVSLRSVVYFGFMTFVPLYFVDELGTSEGAGNAALTIMLVAGAGGTLLGGWVADRTSPRAVFAGSMALVLPLIAAFLVADQALAVVVLAVIGAATIATFSVTVVIGQELLPRHLGVASGVTLGLSIGMGGVGAAALGLLADATSVRTAIEVIAPVSLAALILALTLPGRRRTPRPAEAGADQLATGLPVRSSAARSSRTLAR